MKLGILGTGMIVKDLLLTIDKLKLESIAILGTPHSIEKTKELAGKYHMDTYYFDYDEMLKSDIDTVYAALPNHLHFAFAKKALLNDKHVIMEKPVTSNSGELKELMKIAKKRNLILIEAVNIHYLPAFKELKKNISKVGKPKIVSLNYSQYSSRYDAFKKGIIMPAFDYRKSGGALMDLNVYNINFIVSLFGRPKSVNYAANIEKRIDTSGILTLDYGDFKAVAIGAKDCKAPTVSVIQGDEGSITLYKPVNVMEAYELSINNGTVKNYTVEEPKHRLYYEFKEFIRIINEKDMEKAQEMLDISLIVSEIMEEARKTAKVVFTCEE